MKCSRRPVIYEINSYVWLQELSRQWRLPVNLENVPHEEWDALAEKHFDAIRLMCVWERSPLGIAIAVDDPALTEDFSRTLPDWGAEDNVGSAYCLHDYRVDAELGGNQGLALARRELAKRP